MLPYSSTNMATAWKNSYFILSVRSDFHMIIYLLITVHTFSMCMLTSFSVNEILLPRYTKWTANFRGLLFNERIIPSWLKHMNSVLFEFLFTPIPLTACSVLCSRDSTWVFTRSTASSADNGKRLSHKRWH